MMKARTFILIFAFMIAFLSVPFADRSTLPASYYGTMTVSGGSSEGTLHSCIDGISKGTVLIGDDGKYGIEDSIRLPVVGGSGDGGKTVYFCLGDRRSDTEINWTPGEVTELNISFSDRADGCPACVVDWACTQWSSCYESESGEYLQDCTSVVDNSDCGTDYLKPELIKSCQAEEGAEDGDEDDGGDNDGSPSSSGSPRSSSGTSGTTEANDEEIDDEPEPESTEQVTIPEEIEENREAIFYFENSNVYEIAITFRESVTNPTLTVESYSVLPTELSELPSNKQAHKYLSISKNADSGAVEQVKIKFKVDANWISESGASTDEVKLMHYVSGSWEELPTTFAGTSGTFYLFEATSDSLSFFAIVVDKHGSLDYKYMFYVLALLLIIAFFVKRPKKHHSKHISKKGYRYNISKKR